MVPVLVVDDDDNIRSLLRGLLEDEGYTVFTAEHGGPALDRLRTTVPALLVLLGLMMPHVDGAHVLEAVAADPALAPHRVILVTAGPPRHGRAASLSSASSCGYPWCPSRLTSMTCSPWSRTRWRGCPDLSITVLGTQPKDDVVCCY
jgi:CheY-like chemotaxis protein